jgi:hypothetical protein
MKFSLILILIALLSVSLLAEELTFEEKFKAGNKEITDTFKNDKYIAVSPLLSPRVCLGIITAKQNAKKRWIENNYYIHGFYSDAIRVFGAAVTYNYFWSENRNGFFTQLTGGFDYVYYEPFWFISPGGSTSNSDGERTEGLCPNLSAGFGYSFQMGEDSYLRINWDIGLKWCLSNIYISYVW